MGPRTDRRHQQGEESRQRILDATIEIAADRGYEGTSISLVSRASGLPASSIYWHFANKDELLAAVIDRSFTRWVVSLPGWTPPPPGVTLSEHVRTSWRQTAESLAVNEDFLRLGLMLSLEGRPDEPRARTRFLESRELALRRLCGWFAEVVRWAGLPEDPELCHTLASINLALADGLFIEKQISGDCDRTMALFDFGATMLVGVIERATAAGRGRPGSAPARSGARPQRRRRAR